MKIMYLDTETQWMYVRKKWGWDVKEHKWWIGKIFGWY